jgi:hypothetical protein
VSTVGRFGNGGTQLQANRIGLTDSQLNARGFAGGTIQLQANTIGLTDTELNARGFDGGGGLITLDAATERVSQQYHDKHGFRGGHGRTNYNSWRQHLSVVLARKASTDRIYFDSGLNHFVVLLIAFTRPEP